MDSLSVLQPETRSFDRRWAVPVHVVRVGMFVLILFLIRQNQIQFQNSQTPFEQIARVEVAQIQAAVPSAHEVEPWNASNASRTILDQRGDPIARMIQTSPASDSIVGYVGPTNLLVVLNDQQEIQAIQILESHDTREHVAEVRESPLFFSSFAGFKWDRPGDWPAVDTVSGATLTSLAILKGLKERAGGEAKAGKFSESLHSQELELWLGKAYRIQPIANQASVFKLVPMDGKPGAPGGPRFLARTSPTADSINGYQGPTETWIVFDESLGLVAIAVRASFDNEPYVDYVRSDTYLEELLSGKTPQEIAAFADDQYEGVSGATMTSLSVRDAIKRMATGIPSDPKLLNNPPQSNRSVWPFAWRDMVTMLLGIAAILIGLTRLKRYKKWRVVFQLCLIVYLGFLSGDLLSQALMVGWSRHGLPFQVAPGLVFLALAAILVPVFTKHNVYCHQICPLGAIQQLSKNRIRLQVRLRSKTSRILKWVPVLLVGLVLLTAFRLVDLDLASLEAFDAFSFRVAGWISIAIAVTGIVVSSFVPMAYCRFGCPTGWVLNFLRFHSRSGQIGMRDGLAVAAVVIGWAV